MIVKSDAGTYGMGVMTARSVEDIRNMQGDVGLQTLLAFALLEIDLSAVAEQRVEQPGIDVELAADLLSPPSTRSTASRRSRS